MLKGRVTKNALVGGVITILLSTIFTPIVNSQVLSNGRSDETIPITCRIFTLTNVEEITKEISAENAKRLAQLREIGGCALVDKLNQLGLLGGSSIEKVFSLINGKYQRGLYREFLSSQTDNSSFNLLCYVNFTAGGCMMVPPFPFGSIFHMLGIVNFLLSFGIPPFLLLPLIVPMVLGHIIFIPIDFICEFIGLYIPVKPTLFRGYLVGNDIHLKTTGLLGTKEVYSNYTAVFRMRGFTGIWITNPLTHYSWCKGFAFSVYRWQ